MSVRAPPKYLAWISSSVRFLFTRKMAIGLIRFTPPSNQWTKSFQACSQRWA
jgi:hypothetical protein